MEKLLQAVKSLIDSADDGGCGDFIIVVGLEEFELLQEVYTESKNKVY